MKPLKSGVYFTVTSQFGLATFRELASHMGLVAAELDSTALVPAGGSPPPSLPHFLPLLE